MRKIETLASIEGRKLLRSVFMELKYNKQRPFLVVIFLLWKICVFERNLKRYLNDEIAIIYPLGFIKGTALWLEEVINRFYFSAINSFVYFGAAILLILIGIRRFGDGLADEVIIAGVLFEALMLMFMFIVMLFTPNNDLEDSVEDNISESAELISEVGEIARDFAVAVNKLEELSKNINSLLEKQGEVINHVAHIAQNTADAISPNTELVEQIKATNSVIAEFSNTLIKLNEETSQLKHENIKFAVMNELQRIINNNLNNEK